MKEMKARSLKLSVLFVLRLIAPSIPRFQSLDKNSTQA